MLNNLEEAAIYELSDTLGVEVYIVGVGDQVFIPKQQSSPAHVATREGGLAEWMMACLDNPDEIPWWLHTHPGMPAFFSLTDEDGARELWEAIRKPFFAFVLGENGERHEELIDEAWIAAHPRRAVVPLKWITSPYQKGLHDVLPDLWGEWPEGLAQPGLSQPTSADSTLDDIAYLVYRDGWDAVLEAVAQLRLSGDPEDAARDLVGLDREAREPAPVNAEESFRRTAATDLLDRAAAGDLCLKCGLRPKGPYRDQRGQPYCGRCGNPL